MMSRRQFFRITCSTCIGIPMQAALLSGCAGVKYVEGSLESNGIAVPWSEFYELKNDKPVYRKFIIIRHDQLAYPICVYRFSEMEYSALLMKCTHQGTELQVAGDHLHCSGHGSEFNNKGMVTLGPAEQGLRSFRVIPREESLLIELTKA